MTIDLTHQEIAQAVNQLAKENHANGQHFWHDLITGEPLDRNPGELIELMHSELSEAHNSIARDLPDDHLPDRPGGEVEFADCILRILDYCAYKGYDVGGALIAKMIYNKTREDHKREARLADGGKKI